MMLQLFEITSKYLLLFLKNPGNHRALRFFFYLLSCTVQNILSRAAWWIAH